MAAALEKLTRGILHAVKIQAAADALPPVYFVRDPFRTGDIDKVDAAGDDQQVFLRRSIGIHLLHACLDMIDRAKKGLAVDAQHFDLRTIWQAGVVGEMVATRRGIGLHIENARARGLHQIQNQRQQHAGVNREFQMHQQRRPKRHQHHHRFAVRGAHDGAYLRDINQPIRHHEQYRAHHRQR